MEAQYTVFATRDDGVKCFFVHGRGECPAGLNEAINYVAAFKYQSRGYTPIAFVGERVSGYAGERRHLEALAESIAAGRVIELVDGHYVARGVEEKKEEPLSVECIFDAFFGKQAERYQRLYEIAHPAAADPNAAMIARDYTDAAWAYAKEREQLRQVAQMLAGSLPSTAKPSIAGLTRLTDSSDPKHGSAYLKC